MKKVKIGVIGLGWFGQKHCEALFDIPQVELYALCTRTESRLKELAERFDVKHTYTDYNDLLASPDVEAVSIVTMWDQHAAPTLAALAAGKHVFVAEIIGAGGENGGIGGQCHGRQRPAIAPAGQPDHQLSGEMLAVGCRAAVSAEHRLTTLLYRR